MNNKYNPKSYCKELDILIDKQDILFKIKNNVEVILNGEGTPEHQIENLNKTIESTKIKIDIISRKIRNLTREGKIDGVIG